MSSVQFASSKKFEQLYNMCKNHSPGKNLAVFIHGNIAIDLGVHDIIWKQGNYSTSGLDTKDVSFFAVLSNQKIVICMQ